MIKSYLKFRLFVVFLLFTFLSFGATTVINGPTNVNVGDTERYRIGGFVCPDDPPGSPAPYYLIQLSGPPVTITQPFLPGGPETFEVTFHGCGTVVLEGLRPCQGFDPGIITITVGGNATNATITNPITNLCSGDTYNFNATPSGGTWSVTGGGNINSSGNYTAPTVSSPTSVTVKYEYDSGQLGDCPSEDEVIFTIFPIPSAPIANNQDFCSGDNPTVADLVPNSGYSWYNTSSGGSPLTGGTALTNGTYYVGQTVNGCESPRTPVVITIKPIPPAPSASDQSFCDAATVANLIPSGAGIRWYNSSAGSGVLLSGYNLSDGETVYVGQTVDGCESPRTPVVITINDTQYGTDIQVSCDDFTWIDGHTYSTSNNSAIYTIPGGSRNGCDSIVTLDLTILNTVRSIISLQACESFTWHNGEILTTSGIYKDTIIGGAANGCDSIVTLDLQILQPANGVDIQFSCGDFTWIDGHTYSTNNNSAIYTIPGGAKNGCDSIVRLDLTILDTPQGTDIQFACDEFKWIDGNTYTSSNNTVTYTISGGAANGCDSIVTLDLTIGTTKYHTDEITACDSYKWIDGNTYFSSNSSATFTLQTTEGCDSIVTLDLTILPIATRTETITACGQYTWIDGNTYSSSNNTATYILPGAAANGCDSIITLNLTIVNTIYSTDTQIACESFTWIDGHTYTSSNNTATHTLISVDGCDSIVTLDLTILASDVQTDIQVACESFTWIDGNTYTTNNNTATFTFEGEGQYGCDSVVVLDLTILHPEQINISQVACGEFLWEVNGENYTESGTYTETIAGVGTNGCDSIYTLNLTIYENNINIITAEVHNASCTEIADGSATIYVTGGDGDYDISWYDSYGNLIVTTSGNNSTITGLGEGTYMVYVEDSEGCKKSEKIVITANPIVHANDYQEIELLYCVGEDLFIEVHNPDENTTYTWFYNGEEIHQGSSLKIKKANLSNAGDYQVIAQKEGECPVIINDFHIGIEACKITIVETFSPNNDGVNDYFTVENIEAYPNTEVWIYTRWGIEVYHSENYQNDWDGISQSKLNMGKEVLPEGTYYYVMVLGGDKDLQPEAGKEFTGFVYLKR